jgi:LPXTG-motif cell wall-anchored protein
MPFYLITSGDLAKLIWQHPKWPFSNTGSIQANLVFLVGCGLLAGLLLFLKRKFWRNE